MLPHLSQYSKLDLAMYFMKLESHFDSQKKYRTQLETEEDIDERTALLHEMKVKKEESIKKFNDRYSNGETMYSEIEDVVGNLNKKDLDSVFKEIRRQINSFE